MTFSLGFQQSRRRHSVAKIFSWGAFHHLVKISGVSVLAVNGTSFVGSCHWKIPRLEFPNGISCSIYTFLVVCTSSRSTARKSVGHRVPSFLPFYFYLSAFSIQGARLSRSLEQGTGYYDDTNIFLRHNDLATLTTSSLMFLLSLMLTNSLFILPSLNSSFFTLDVNKF